MTESWSRWGMFKNSLPLQGTVWIRLVRASNNLNFDFWWKYYSRARTIMLAGNQFPLSSIDMMRGTFDQARKEFRRLIGPT